MTVCKEGTRLLGLILGLVQCLPGMFLGAGMPFGTLYKSRTAETGLWPAGPGPHTSGSS